MCKLILPIFALLWGFPALAQDIPPGTSGMACLATANTPALNDNFWGRVTCDLAGGLRLAGGGGGSASAAPGGVFSISRIQSSAATNNLTVAKATAGRLYKIVACNTTTTAARIKFYNNAAPVVGTTTPFLTRPLPAASAAGGLACASYDQSSIGWSFSTAISYALVTGAADNDNTAVAAAAITDLSVEFQ